MGVKICLFQMVSFLDACWRRDASIHFCRNPASYSSEIPPNASFALQVLSFAMKIEWQWNFQAIWAPKNGMHLWWVGNVYILILALVESPWLKASPIFQVNGIHHREQLASNCHDALGSLICMMPPRVEDVVFP